MHINSSGEIGLGTTTTNGYRLYVNGSQFINGSLNLSGSILNNGSVSEDDGFGIYWDSSGSSAYGIFREGGAWNSPFPDLRIAFHTGIKLGANSGYNGIRFYNEYDMATQVMSINNGSDGLGANNVYVNNSLQAGSSLRAPIFYDSDDTAYYANPASTSIFNIGKFVKINVNGDSYINFNDEEAAWGIRTRNALSTTQLGGNLKNIFYSGGGLNEGIVFKGAEYLGINALEVKNSGIAWAYASFRAPIFYDSDNTGYYVDPATGTNLNGTLVNNGGTAMTAGWNRNLLLSSTFPVIVFNSNSTKYSGIGVDYSNAAAGMYFWVNGSSADISGTATVALGLNTGNFVTAYGSFRAPIFYDSDDTNYYVDGNAGTALKYLRVNGDWGGSPFGSGSETLTVTGTYASICQRQTNGAQAYVLHHVSDSYYLYIGRGSTNGSDWNWALRAMPNQDGSYVIFNTSARAPIFYDSNDTNYYVDPNSTSVLNGLTVGGYGVVRTAQTINSNIDSDYGETYVTFDPVPSGSPPISSPNIHTINVGNNFARRTQIAFTYDHDRAWFRRRNDSGWQSWYEFAVFGNTASNGSLYGTIYYDGNDTNYYVDPASTSRVNVISFVSGASFGPYFQYNNQSNLRLQAGAQSAAIGISGYDYNGNWKFQLYGDNSGYGFLNGNWAAWDIKKIATGNLYLNGETTYYIGTNEIYYNRVYGIADIRSPIFYDNNNTGYYIDGNNTSYLNSLYLYGGLTTTGNTRLGQSSGTTTRIDDILQVGASDSGDSHLYFGEDTSSWYGAHWYWDSGYTHYWYSRNGGTDSMLMQYATNDTSKITFGRNLEFNTSGKGVIGAYDSTKYQGVFAMGASYKLPDDGTGVGSLYGIAWSHPNAGGVAANLASHGMLILESGLFRGAWGGGRLVTTSDIRSTIFYDYDNTGYYVDPTGNANIAGSIYVGGWFRNYGVVGLYNETYGNHWYATGNDYWNLAGNNASNIGIILRSGGHQGTIRGYVYADSSNNVGFLNNGGSWRLRVVDGDYILADGSSIRGQLFYDSNDTNYYLDPNSQSNLYRLNVAGYPMRSSTTIDMSNTSLYSTSNYYPVVINLPTGMPTRLRIVNALNSNVPSWATHGSGFTCHVEWTSNGSGWGTIAVNRTIHRYTETYANSTICGGITQMTNSSKEVIWLRGGGQYYFESDSNVTPTAYYGTYTDAGQSVTPQSSTINNVWQAASTHMSVGAIKAAQFIDVNDEGYYLDPNGTSKLNNLQVAGGISDPSTNGRIYLYGNLHIDAFNGYDIYANYYSGRRFKTFYGSQSESFRCDTDGIVYAYSQFRTPIIYDSNDAGYYVDPNSYSNLYRLSTYFAAKDQNTNWTTAFQNTPTSGMAWHGDVSSGGPTGTWWFYQSMRHSNSSNYWGTQIAYGWEDNANEIYQRNITSNSFGGWVRYINTNNWTSIIPTASPTVTGVWLFRSNKGSGVYSGNTNTPPLQVYSDDSGAAFMSFHRSGSYAVNMGLDPDNIFRIGGWSASSNRLQLDMAGNLWSASSMRSPIFYDENNTGYYFDGAGTSVANNVQITTLGVGTAASGTTGEIRATNNITAYYSDERLKTRLGKIEDPIAKVKSLSGFYFEANETAVALGYDKKREVGVSAQEVQAVLPEIIAPAPISDKYMTVRYEKLIPLLIEAIKEQQNQIEQLSNELKSLKNKL